tara:strand:- start:41795 stop:42070 length:276 start_codon:yes stop_codon:yes gene_type:complete
MNLDITFRHLEHTPALDTKIRDKVNRVAKKLSPTAHYHWTSWVEHDAHISTLAVKDGSRDFFAKAESGDLYKTIDLAIKKLENQLAHQHHS